MRKAKLDVVYLTVYIRLSVAVPTSFMLKGVCPLILYMDVPQCLAVVGYDFSWPSISCNFVCPDLSFCVMLFCGK
jgi:hypothetical protein